MIDVKKAVDKAREYFAALYPDKNPSALQLEEVELSEDENYWLITLSHTSTTHTALPIPPIVKKEYKTFRIRAGTGEVLGMKIRQVK